MTTGDPDEILFKQSMDALNFMMIDQRVPIPNRRVVRDYFRRSKTLQKRKSYYALIDACLSTELRGDVRYLISSNLFQHVWWLAACERDFLEDLSVFIDREAFAAKEKIPSGPDILNILMQGVATRGGNIIGVGGHWGDIIIQSPMLRDTREARALGYCEIAKLPRDALDMVSKTYPRSASKIREAAIKIAIARSMMVIAMYAQLHKANATRKAMMQQARNNGGLTGGLMHGVPQVSCVPTQMANLGNGMPSVMGGMGGEAGVGAGALMALNGNGSLNGGQPGFSQPPTPFPGIGAGAWGHGSMGPGGMGMGAGAMGFPPPSPAMGGPGGGSFPPGMMGPEGMGPGGQGGGMLGVPPWAADGGAMANLSPEQQQQQMELYMQQLHLQQQQAGGPWAAPALAPGMAHGGMPPWAAAQAAQAGGWQPQYIDGVSSMMMRLRPGTPYETAPTISSPSDGSRPPNAPAPAPAKKGGKKEKTRPASAAAKAKGGANGGGNGHGDGGESGWRPIGGDAPPADGHIYTPNPMHPHAVTPNAKPGGWGLHVRPPASPNVELSELPNWALEAGRQLGPPPNFPSGARPPPNFPSGAPPGYGGPYAAQQQAMEAAASSPMARSGGVKRTKPGDVLKKLRASLESLDPTGGDGDVGPTPASPTKGSTVGMATPGSSGHASSCASPSKATWPPQSLKTRKAGARNASPPSKVAESRISRAPHEGGAARSRAVVPANGSELTMSAAGAGGLQDGMGALDAKLDAMLAAQAETQQQVEAMSAKLGRLDALSTSVSQINLTLRRASDRSRADHDASSHPTPSPSRPPSRLPGQGGRRGFGQRPPPATPQHRPDGDDDLSGLEA